MTINTTEQPKLLLTVKEAAARLSVSRSHLYEQFITPKRLRVVHIGSSVRVLAADLEALVDELVTKAGEPHV